MNGNETSKTGGFLVAAALVVAVAWATRPTPPSKTTESVVGQVMFRNLKDPKDVTSLLVLQFDQTSRQPVRFEVAKENQRWLIPSHSKYPADAKEHLATAANAFMDLKIIGVAPGFSQQTPTMDQSVVRKFHNMYGVIDPDPEHVQASDDGVGMRISMKDKEGHDLASAIVGKSLPDQPDHRYIRYPDKEPVYIASFDSNKLSVKFEEWIERNLLNLNSINLQKVQIKDYTFDLGDERAPLKVKGQMVLACNVSGDSAWKMIEELAPDTTKTKPEEIRLVHRTMAADEELDAKKLDDLKFALDDLKIVDVERKPGAVPADLRIKSIEDAKVAKSLASRGFFPLQDPSGPEGQFQLISSKGEISLLLNDGARYVLRFGETTGEPSAAVDKSKDVKDAKKDESTPALNRYLFVMADFNQEAIIKPAFEKIPEEKPDDKKPEDKKKEEKKDDATKVDIGKKDESKKDDKKKDEVKKDEPKVDIKAERERIEKENKRKQEEYDAKVTAGKKHVKDLNTRFADWYYVISDDVYRKIHLGRESIVKKKEKAKDKPKDADGHDHSTLDHADHDHAIETPSASPVQSLENLKKDAP